MSKKALTPAQVRERLRRNGQTLTQWAAERGYDRKAVYRVMAGQDKGHYGRSHEIAVALGLKVPDVEPSTADSAGNTRVARAA
jgi:gp16 family phage-associated protein